jgi:hypothetical protein
MVDGRGGLDAGVVTHRRAQRGEERTDEGEKKEETGSAFLTHGEARPSNSTKRTADAVAPRLDEHGDGGTPRRALARHDECREGEVSWTSWGKRRARGGVSAGWGVMPLLMVVAMIHADLGATGAVRAG